MTLAQMISEVQQILGWRSDRSTEITNALNFAQVQREKPGATFPPWLWKEDQSMTPLTIGNQILYLPADYIQDSPERDGNLRYKASPLARTFFLKKMDYESAEKYYFGDWQSNFDQQATTFTSALSPGAPKSYVLRQNSIRIYPIPDKNYVLTWSYWGLDLTGDLWRANAPWVLIGDAALKLGSDLGNSQAVSTATAILQKAEADMFRATIHREAAGRSYSMGRKL